MTRVFFLSFLLFWSRSVSWAQEALFDAREVARLSEARYVGHDSSTALVMRLINARGEIRTREFLRYHKELKEGKTTLLKFLRPNDIKDTGTLNIEVKGKDDIQYLYLPASRKLRRVSAKNQSWVGSDISYEDLQQIEIGDYTYEPLGLEVLDGSECYVYSMMPVSEEKSIYGRQIHWVTKDTYVPLKIEYYEKNGSLLKITHATDIREIEGASYGWLVVCQNVQDGHRTEIERLWIFLNTGLEDEFLTTRHLEKSIEFYNHPENIWSVWRAASSSQNAQLS